MMRFCKHVLLLVFGCALMMGCGQSNSEVSTPAIGELEQYALDHPEVNDPVPEETE